MARIDSDLEARCLARGIRPEFRPRIQMAWMSRGANGSSERRAELRKTAQARIAHLEATAKRQIEAASIEAQTILVSGGLQSDEARTFLASMPTADELMPPLTLAELDPLAAILARQPTKSNTLVLALANTDATPVLGIVLPRNWTGS